MLCAELLNAYLIMLLKHFNFILVSNLFFFLFFKIENSFISLKITDEFGDNSKINQVNLSSSISKCYFFIKIFFNKMTALNEPLDKNVSKKSLFDYFKQ